MRWYGGDLRYIEVVTGLGHWYRQGQGLVEVRWTYVRDLTGNHREEYFFSTSPGMSVRCIVETFVGRWDIEVTFEEMREHLGLETTRGRCRNTVLRVEPGLFMLYTVIVYWFVHLPRREREKIHLAWAGKTSITFSDALASVRRNAWDDYLFQHAGHSTPIEKLSKQKKRTILNALAIAS